MTYVLAKVLNFEESFLRENQPLRRFSRLENRSKCFSTLVENGQKHDNSSRPLRSGDSRWDFRPRNPRKSKISRPAPYASIYAQKFIWISATPIQTPENRPPNLPYAGIFQGPRFWPFPLEKIFGETAKKSQKYQRMAFLSQEFD